MGNSQVGRKTNENCWYCGDPAWTLDHIPPKSIPWANAKRQTVKACADCNCKILQDRYRETPEEGAQMIYENLLRRSKNRPTFRLSERLGWVRARLNIKRPIQSVQTVPVAKESHSVAKEKAVRLDVRPNRPCGWCGELMWAKPYRGIYKRKGWAKLKRIYCSDTCAGKASWAKQQSKIPTCAPDEVMVYY